MSQPFSNSDEELAVAKAMSSVAEHEFSGEVAKAVRRSMRDDHQPRDTFGTPPAASGRAQRGNGALAPRNLLASMRASAAEARRNGNSSGGVGTADGEVISSVAARQREDLQSERVEVDLCSSTDSADAAAQWKHTQKRMRLRSETLEQVAQGRNGISLLSSSSSSVASSVHAACTSSAGARSAPSAAASGAPSGASSGAPSGASSAAPSGAASAAPRGASSAAPRKASSAAPRAAPCVESPSGERCLGCPAEVLPLARYCGGDVCVNMARVEGAHGASGDAADQGSSDNVVHAGTGLLGMLVSPPKATEHLTFGKQMCIAGDATQLRPRTEKSEACSFAKIATDGEWYCVDPKQITVALDETHRYGSDILMAQGMSALSWGDTGDASWTQLQEKLSMNRLDDLKCAHILGTNEAAMHKWCDEIAWLHANAAGATQANSKVFVWEDTQARQYEDAPLGVLRKWRLRKEERLHHKCPHACNPCCPA